MSLLSCERMTLRYGHMTAVQEVSFTVEKGELLCIVGENGSGKSTLIKGILGLHPLAEGDIIWGEGVRKSVGYLPQRAPERRDFPASVTEVVFSGLLSGSHRPWYTAEEKERAFFYMERLKISDLRKKSYRALSGGQQQRVLLCRALCGARKMILLDEPANGLDPLASGELYDLLDNLRREEKLAAVMVTHDWENAMKYADRILHMATRPLFLGNAEEYRQYLEGRVDLS